MNLTQFKETLFARGKALGFTDMELYFQSNAKNQGSVFKGQIDNFTLSEDGGISFRGLYQGRMGYSYTERIDESSIAMLLQGAQSGALVNDGDQAEPLHTGSPSYPAVETYSELLENVAPDRQAALLKEIEAEAYRLDPRVSNVNMCISAVSRNQRFIANTHGLTQEDRHSAAFAGVSVVVKQDGDIKNAFGVRIAKDFATLDAKAIAREAVEEAVSLLGASPVESRAYRIILRNTTAGMLLYTFAGIFSGSNVQRGKSLLKGKLGQPVAAPHITLVDDPLLAEGHESRSFDWEGVASRRLAVIENGVLKSFLHNKKSAAADGVESTGHGYKPSYKGAITISQSNLFFQPGSRSLDELIAGESEALVITSLQGLHSGANPISGDFSLAAHGYWVADGKIVRPVNQITVAGNFYTVLNEILEVGNDLDWSKGGGVPSPSLLIKSLAVAGK